MRIERFARFLIAAALVLAATLSAVARAGEPETLRVGVCLPLSGSFASYGRVNLAGMQLFLRDFNARSAETGIKLDLLVRDDRSSPEEAARITRDLARIEKVPAIVGSATSNIMLAMIEEAKKNRVVLISPGATSPLIGKADDWAFKVLPGDDYQGGALARFLVRQMGTRSAAMIVNSHFDYGRHIADAFAKTYTRLGGVVVADEQFDWDLESVSVPDFEPILRRIKKLNPEVVLLPGYPKEVVEILRVAEGLDMNVIFCGGDAWLSTDLFLAGDRLDDSYYIGSAEVYSRTPAARKFAELLEVSTDPFLEPYSVDGYDALMLVAEAARAGARTGEEIRDFLYSLRRFPLAAGNISFTRDGGTAKSMFIYRVSKMSDGFFTEMVMEIQPD